MNKKIFLMLLSIFTLLILSGLSSAYYYTPYDDYTRYSSRFDSYEDRFEHRSTLREKGTERVALENGGYEIRKWTEQIKRYEPKQGGYSYHSNYPSYVTPRRQTYHYYWN